MGNYVELGRFRSVKSRAGIRWSEAKRQKLKEKRGKSDIEQVPIPKTESEQRVEQIKTYLMASLKAYIEKTMERAKRGIPDEYSHKRV